MSVSRVAVEDALRYLQNVAKSALVTTENLQKARQMDFMNKSVEVLQLLQDGEQ